MDPRTAKILARQEKIAAFGDGAFVGVALLLSFGVAVLDLFVYWLEGQTPSGWKTPVATVFLIAVLVPLSLWLRRHLKRRVAEIKAGARIWRPADIAEADGLTAIGATISMLAMLIAFFHPPNAEALVLMPISAGPVLTLWGTLKRFRIYWKQSPDARRQKYVITPMAWFLYVLSLCTQACMVPMTIMLSTHSFSELAETLRPYLR